VSFFNRKSTVFEQVLHKLEMRVNALRSELEEEKSRNNRNLLEYAELGEKMRRLYLRIARRQKIEEGATSEKEPVEQNEHKEETPLQIRQKIESSLGYF